MATPAVVAAYLCSNNQHESLSRALPLSHRIGYDFDFLQLHGASHVRDLRNKRGCKGTCYRAPDERSCSEDMVKQPTLAFPTINLAMQDWILAVHLLLGWDDQKTISAADMEEFLSKFLEALKSKKGERWVQGLGLGV